MSKPPEITAVQKKQVPEFAKKFDDPWGITWRVINVFRRFDARRSMRFQAARFKQIRHTRPVFIIGPPRSGTSTLFHLLSHHSQLGSLWKEGHDLWRAYHHPRRTGWKSDWVRAGEVRPGERSFVSRYLYSYFDQPRFVEKTPENCLRIAYLLELFPDAQFVFLRRDPRATISSLINGWRHPQGRFRAYFVPEELKMPGYTRPRQWCFALIEGWRDYRTKTIPEIAAEQWRQCMQGALEGRRVVPAAQWYEMTLEDYVADPKASVAKLLEWLELPRDRDIDAFLSDDKKVNAGEGSEAGDWSKNAAEIEPLLPRLLPELREGGYDLRALGLA